MIFMNMPIGLKEQLTNNLLQITPPTLPPEMKKIRLKLIAATPPTLPVPAPAPIPLFSDTNVHFVVGEDGAQCLGAFNPNHADLSQLSIKYPDGDGGRYRLSEVWDCREGIWLDSCPGHDALFVGILNSDSKKVSPLPAHCHRVRVDPDGIHSVIQNDPAFHIKVPLGIFQKMNANNNQLQMAGIDNDLEKEVIRITPATPQGNTESVPAKHFIESLNTTITFDPLPLRSSIKIETEYPPENGDSQDIQLRLILKGNRPTQILMRMEGPAAIPPIHVSLDTIHSEETLSLSNAGSGAAVSHAIFIETDEQIVTYRTHPIPIPKPDSLRCWPPILRWKTTENQFTIGVFQDARSGKDLEVIFPPELSTSWFEKDKKNPAKLLVHLTGEKPTTPWMGWITIRDRSSRAMGRIPMVRNIENEVQPTK